MKSNKIIAQGLERHRSLSLAALIAAMLIFPSAVFAQGSITGTVQNSDLSTPANGEIFFVGFLDNTDEEIRIESSDGAGYESGNWYDDFQNYLTEAAGNPYDYYFVNSINGEAYHLEGLIPANSFQVENIQLATASLPAAPTSLSAAAISTSSMLITWSGSAGLTYHVYRRNSTSNGSYFRLDNTGGSLADPGVSNEYFVDNTVDGVSSYTYVIIAEDASGNYSAHSAQVTANSATPVAPTVTSVDPATGVTVGGTAVDIFGTGFDPAGVTVTFGGIAAGSIVVVAPDHITASTPAGTGAVDVTVANTASGLSGTLVSGYTYYTNTPPVADAGPDQLGQFKNEIITLDGSASSDTDLDPLNYHWKQTSGPETVTLSDTNAVSPTFTANTNGDYYFDLTVDDGVDESTADAVYIEIVERAPVLASIGSQLVDEGANLNFGVSATDPDGTTPSLSAEDVPTNASFLDNGDGTGTFDFNPDFLQAGTYNVRFIATDGVLSDTEIVAITVNDAGNQAPVLATIGPKSVTEGANLNFGVSATDPDATTPSLTAENIPLNSTFLDNGDGTGTFDFNPDYTQAGTFNVRFIASDGALADTEVVVITVNDAGNQAPVLASIGSQTVTEGDNLNFSISASDPDATIPTLTAEDVPTNATFLDSGDGTGVFDFNPDYIQAGTYNVRFIASDGGLADTEVVAITVNEAGNQAPVLASIGSQVIDEGANLNFGVSATDPDATIPSLTAEDVPLNASFLDNGDGTGTFDFNPDFTQSGTYNVRFIASDGVLADTEVVAITVNDAGNQAPILATIGPKSVTEGSNLNFGVSASDPDLTIPSLTAEDVPINATFFDNGDGTGVFDFNPDYTQSGTYNVRFIASDGVLADTEVVAVTVDDAGNQAPLLAAIGSQTVTEGGNLNFSISASDPDATIPALTAEDVPTNATFLDNGDGTGVFDFNPDYLQAGTYNVRFIASDGSLADTEVVAITVDDAGNQAPVLASIGSQLVDEGANLNFSVSASDPDATIPALTAEDVPTNATFLDNGDGTGVFDFTPDFTQGGSYDVRFIASDGALADTEVVTITVNDAGNQAPVLATIGSKTVTEGANLNFSVSASDADATIPSLTAEDVPTNATFLDNGDGTGVFDFNPNYIQAGTYNVRFIASDGALADTEVVTITVDEAGNQVPVLATIGAQSVTEGVNLNLVMSAADPDSTVPSLIAEDLPLNASFLDNGDGTGVFDFTPDYIQAGIYNVRFIASDGVLADTEVVEITVNDAGNQAPVLASIGSQLVDEGANLNFGVSASDPDATIPSLAAEDLPLNASFVDNGDGTGTFDFSPDFTQAGIYNVRFIASDGVLADTEVVAVTVNDAGNQAPVLAGIGSQAVGEGSNLNFTVSATDADSTIPALTAEDIPLNATFLDNTDGTGVFDFNPDYTQAGTYDVRFIASDGVLADTEIVSITVTDEGNQAPVLAAIGAQSVIEGDSLILPITASDPDGTFPTIVAEDVPTNAAFVDNGDGTATFDFRPDYIQVGIYNVRFIASDGEFSDSELVEITVIEAGNQAPVVTVVDSQTVVEGDLLSFGVIAIDPDATIPALTVENIPLNSTFIDNGDGTGTFDFTPDSSQAGEYTVDFIASDGLLADTGTVVITVINSNLAPVLDPIGPRVVGVNDTLNFVVTASDYDGTIPSLTAEDVPVGATFTDLLDGTGVFDFPTDPSDLGVYFVTFIASDGELADTEVVTVTVTEDNFPPEFAAIAPQIVNEGITLRFNVSATDPEGGSVDLFLVDGPVGGSFVDSGNGIGTYQIKPNYYQAGEDTIRFAAVDDGDPAATGLLRLPLTIVDVNRPPVFDSVLPQSVLLGDSLMLRLVASDSTDPDGGALFIEEIRMPDNSTLVDSGGGIASFKYKPDVSQVGVDTAVFVCYDDESTPLSSVLSFEITTVMSNQPPTLEEIGPRTVTEGFTLEFNIYATDPDGPFMSLYTDELPRNAAFVDSGNGVGTFTFSPDYLQSGLESVKFFVTDGILTDYENVIIQIYDNPQPPIITVPDDTSLTEGETLELFISAIDPDSTIPSLTLDTLVYPLNVTFVDSGNGHAGFVFSPVFVQAGVYDFTFIAGDETGLADSGIVTVNVQDAGNQLPLWTHMNSEGVDLPLSHEYMLTELDELVFTIFTTDADSVPPVLSASPLPGASTFTDNQDFTGTFSWSTGYADSGVYEITFYAIDGVDPQLEDSVKVSVIVGNSNRPPVSIYFFRDGADWFAPYEDDIDEGQVRIYGINAIDPDSVSPLIRVRGLDVNADTVLPLFDNAVLVDNGDNTGTVTFSPDYFQAGEYAFRVFAKDAEDTTVYIQKDFSVTVANRPQNPVLDPIPSPITVVEGDSVELVITYTDPDLPAGASLTLSYSPQLENAGIFAIDNNSSQFYFYPWFDQSGTYDIRFQVMDNTFRIDSQTVAITVEEAGPQPPILYVPFAPEDTINLGSPLVERIWAVDPEGDPITLTALNLPLNAAFVDSGNGAGSFTFDPDETQGDQAFNMTFVGSDGIYDDSVDVEIYVQAFICGDVTKDGNVDIDDIVYLVGWIFSGGPAPDPLVSGDVHRTDCPDVVVDIDDVTHLVGYIFGGGAPPDCTCP